MKKILQQTPLFLFLIPFFFVLHGYSENFGYITLANCLLLLLTYAGASAFLYFIFFFFFKNYIKAALMASYFFSFYCFFGALHDFLKNHVVFLSKYAVLLSSFFLGVIVLFIFLKKTKQYFYKPVLFVNLLLIIYIIFDTSSVIFKSLSTNPKSLSVNPVFKNNSGSICKECKKPDIYFLLFDEYASSISLKQKYNHDNSELDTFLLQKGFNIQVNSHSNYNLTPFSMSSILNMSYINNLDAENVTVQNYADCNNLIRNNEVIKFLTLEGYDIINYSVFDLGKIQSRVEQSLLPLEKKLITDRTLFAYIKKDIGWLIYNGMSKLKMFKGYSFYSQMENNNKFIDLTEKESAVNTLKPRFVYAHLYLPHIPYFFDKNKKLKGEANVYSEFMKLQSRPDLKLQPYLDYLSYTNTRVKELITTIQQNTDNNAVIIFMGDHGLRLPTTNPHPDNHFQNQNAIYFPDKDYHLLKDSVNGVNQFRIILNKLFNQDIPLLKDSTFFLKDKLN